MVLYRQTMHVKTVSPAIEIIDFIALEYSNTIQSKC